MYLYYSRCLPFDPWEWLPFFPKYFFRAQASSEGWVKGVCGAVPAILPMRTKCNQHWGNHRASPLAPSHPSVPTWGGGDSSQQSHVLSYKNQSAPQNFSNVFWRKRVLSSLIPLLEEWDPECPWPLAPLHRERWARKRSQSAEKSRNMRRFPGPLGAPTQVTTTPPESGRVTEFPPESLCYSNILPPILCFT